MVNKCAVYQRKKEKKDEKEGNHRRVVTTHNNVKKGKKDFCDTISVNMLLATYRGNRKDM